MLLQMMRSGIERLIAGENTENASLATKRRNGLLLFVSADSVSTAYANLLTQLFDCAPLPEYVPRRAEQGTASQAASDPPRARRTVRHGTSRKKGAEFGPVFVDAAKEREALDRCSISVRTGPLTARPQSAACDRSALHERPHLRPGDQWVDFIVVPGGSEAAIIRRDHPLPPRQRSRTSRCVAPRVPDAPPD